MEERITIKGSRDGLRLTLHPTAAWAEVLIALEKQLAKGTSFFQGARLLIDIGERPTSDSELEALLRTMHEYGLEPGALITPASASPAPAQPGPVRPPEPERQPERPLPAEGHESIFVWRTLRSGQEIRHVGHVVVVGDVNAGAEIVAGGSVIIWGRLRGSIHAGATGDSKAMVCALEFNPTMLRIAELITRTPDNNRPTRPEQATIDAGQIVVVPWDAPRR